MKNFMKSNLMRYSAVIGVVIFFISTQLALASGPGSIKNCSVPVNLSNSEGYSSIDPFMIADPAGVVHLFWAERIFGDPGSGGTDAVMYSKWDGEHWSEPNNIFLSPPNYDNRRIAGMRGVLDNKGIIHLAWMGPDNTFYYSTAPAYQAGIASAWKKPLLLAEDQIGEQYSFDIVYEPPQTLHIMYGTERENDASSVAYIRSVDGGRTWSDAEDIFIFTGLDHGASNIRLLVDTPNKIYATWTEWDLSGNGQAIYFTRSLDGGASWEYPTVLDTREENDYERDWTNIALLDRNQLVVMWEGGLRAYPQAQYSYDDGETWTDPIDTFPWLIADNGYANLLWDTSGRLHTFLVRRIREGTGDVCRFPGCVEAEARGTTNTLWHSVWEGGTIWRSPEPVGEILYQTPDGDYAAIGGNFSAVAFNRGNQLVAAWFDYTRFELMAMQCTVEGLSVVAPKTTPTPTVTPELTPTPQATPTELRGLFPTPQLDLNIIPQGVSTTAGRSTNPSIAILSGIFVSMFLIIVAVIAEKYRRRK